MVCFGVRAGSKPALQHAQPNNLNDTGDFNVACIEGRVWNPPLQTILYPPLQMVRLNGQPVAVIHADLTAGNGEENTNITQAKILLKNAKTSFIGTQKNGAFDVAGELARVWLTQPNPNGKPNSEVVKPWANGMDITRRPSDTWIVDFGVSMSEADASLFELPFEHGKEFVKPMRELVNREGHRKYWWRHGETRDGLRKAVAPLKRFIATPRVSKYRLFVWFEVSVLPDCATVAIAKDDDTIFGILHSRFHELWSLGLCTFLEDRPRYTPTMCFETFPFLNGLTHADEFVQPKTESVKIGA